MMADKFVMCLILLGIIGAVHVFTPVLLPLFIIVLIFIWAWRKLTNE